MKYYENTKHIIVREVSFVPYRPVRLVFTFPVPWLVQKQGCFVPENIPAHSWSFRPYRRRYRISAGKCIQDRNKKNCFFRTLTFHRWWSLHSQPQVDVVDWFWLLLHSHSNLRLRLHLHILLLLSLSLSLSLSLHPSNFLFLTLFLSFSNLSNDI